MQIDEVRREVLAAVLARAGAVGWSERCWRAAAAAVGTDLSRVAFPRGISDVIRYFVAQGDSRAAEALSRYDLEGMRVRERVATAVRLRLIEHAGRKLALRALVTALATPCFAGVAGRALYGTVDGIWYAVGDASTDLNFYTKRALLAGVYTTTLLYWLDDESVDSAATWRFLDDRIAEVMGIQRLRGRIAAIVAGLLFVRPTNRPTANA